MLSPRYITKSSSPRKSRAMSTQCARPSGASCGMYVTATPQREPSPTAARISSAVSPTMIPISRDAGRGHVLDPVEQDRLVGDGHELLRARVRDRPQPGARASRQDESLHRSGQARRWPGTPCSSGTRPGLGTIWPCREDPSVSSARRSAWSSCCPRSSGSGATGRVRCRAARPLDAQVAPIAKVAEQNRGPRVRASGPGPLASPRRRSASRSRAIATSSTKQDSARDQDRDGDVTRLRAPPGRRRPVRRGQRRGRATECSATTAPTTRRSWSGQGPDRRAHAATLAHELTHVLQDQHFDLAKIHARTRRTTPTPVRWKH